MTVSNFEIARKRPDRPAGKSRHFGRNAKTRRNDRFDKSARNPAAEIPATETPRHIPYDAHAEFDPGHLRGIEAIRDELTGVYRPQSPEEFRIVERLAIAQCDLADARHALDERLLWQKAHAGELYDRGQIERFRADLNAWRTDPHGMNLIFGQSFHSATFLSDLWNTVEIGLDSPVGLTFDQIKNVILSQSGDWRVDRLDALRGRLMSWFLALRPDAARVIERWVVESRAGRSDIAAIEDDMNRARTFLAAAPSVEEAKRNLLELASDEYQAWSARADRQFEAYLDERDRFTEVPPPHPLGDASDVRETRRIQRALAMAETRFDKLERRLLELRKSRTRRNSTPCPDSETVRPSAIESMGNTMPRDDLDNAMTSSQTWPDHPAEETVSCDTETDSVAPNQSSRRPDPKMMAKAWRSKHDRKSKFQNRGGKVTESSSRKVDVEEALAHS